MASEFLSEVLYEVDALVELEVMVMVKVSTNIFYIVPVFCRY